MMHFLVALPGFCIDIYSLWKKIASSIYIELFEMFSSFDIWVMERRGGGPGPGGLNNFENFDKFLQFEETLLPQSSNTLWYTKAMSVGGILDKPHKTYTSLFY